MRVGPGAIPLVAQANVKRQSGPDLPIILNVQGLAPVLRALGVESRGVQQILTRREAQKEVGKAVTVAPAGLRREDAGEGVPTAPPLGLIVLGPIGSKFSADLDRVITLDPIDVVDQVDRVLDPIERNGRIPAEPRQTGDSGIRKTVNLAVRSRRGQAELLSVRLARGFVIVDEVVTGSTDAKFVDQARAQGIRMLQHNRAVAVQEHVRIQREGKPGYVVGVVV